MAEASLRAARNPTRGGLPNALFVLAAAESPPAELCRRANLVTVTLPWGSLLLGALALDDEAAAGIAALVEPDGTLEVLVSVADRDAARLGIAPLARGDHAAIGDRWAHYGLVVDAFEPVAAEAVAATGSTWARRLTAGGRTANRAIWRLSLRLPSTEPSTGRR
jgi:16S rRNA (adenine(1408)-N(1))-methyltransferase